MRDGAAAVDLASARPNAAALQLNGSANAADAARPADYHQHSTAVLLGPPPGHMRPWAPRLVGLLLAVSTSFRTRPISNLNGGNVRAASDLGTGSTGGGGARRSPGTPFPRWTARCHAAFPGVQDLVSDLTARLTVIPGSLMAARRSTMAGVAAVSDCR